MELIIGYDNGRLYTKTVGAEQKILTINAICRGYQLRTLENKIEIPELQMDFNLYEEDVKIGRFFIGGMATKNHSGDLVFSTSGMRKFSPELINFEKAKFMGNQALLAFKQGVKMGEVIDCYVGTGLPIEEYFDSQESSLEKFIQEIVGKRYRVEFLSEVFRNYQLELRVKGMEKTAEGTASLTGTRVKLENGKIVMNDFLDQYLKLGPILVVNLGSSTSDLAVLLEDGTYDPRGFIGLSIGSEWALDYMSRQLKEVHGYMPTKIELEALVLNGKNLRFKGETIPLVDIAKEAYGLLLNQLRNKLYEALRTNNIDKNALGAVFYTGGTSEFLVKCVGSDHVKELIKNVPGLLSADPIFDDAKGYFMIAYMSSIQQKQQLTGIVSEADEEVVEVS